MIFGVQGKSWLRHASVTDRVSLKAQYLGQVRNGSLAAPPIWGKPSDLFDLLGQPGLYG